MNLINQKQLVKILGISRSAFYEKMKHGLWPKPIKIAPRANRWFQHEVEEMIRLMATGASDEQIRRKVEDIHEARERCVGAFA